jgi:hypothetical protein
VRFRFAALIGGSLHARNNLNTKIGAALIHVALAAHSCARNNLNTKIGAALIHVALATLIHVALATLIHVALHA